jgi:hypothetical protein
MRSSRAFLTLLCITVGAFSSACIYTTGLETLPSPAAVPDTAEDGGGDDVAPDKAETDLGNDPEDLIDLDTQQDAPDTPEDTGIDAGDPCQPDPCNGHGRCTANGAEFECACDEEYGGDTCETCRNEDGSIICSRVEISDLMACLNKHCAGASDAAACANAVCQDVVRHFSESCRQCASSNSGRPLTDIRAACLTDRVFRRNSANRCTEIACEPACSHLSGAVSCNVSNQETASCKCGETEERYYTEVGCRFCSMSEDEDNDGYASGSQPATVPANGCIGYDDCNPTNPQVWMDGQLTPTRSHVSAGPVSCPAQDLGVLATVEPNHEVQIAHDFRVTAVLSDDDLQIVAPVLFSERTGYITATECSGWSPASCENGGQHFCNVTALQTPPIEGVYSIRALRILQSIKDCASAHREMEARTDEISEAPVLGWVESIDDPTTVCQPNEWWLGDGLRVNGQSTGRSAGIISQTSTNLIMQDFSISMHLATDDTQFVVLGLFGNALECIGLTVENNAVSLSDGGTSIRENQFTNLKWSGNYDGTSQCLTWELVSGATMQINPFSALTGAGLGRLQIQVLSKNDSAGTINDCTEAMSWYNSNPTPMRQTMGTLVVEAGEPTPHQLAITEIMVDPVAVPDTDGEWFEVLNTGARAVSLENVVVSDSGGEEFTVSSINGNIVLNAGQRFVFGRSADSSTNGDVPVDYEYGTSFNLGNGNDEIILTLGGVELDRIVYAGIFAFPTATAGSIQLGAEHDASTVNNNTGSLWCPSKTKWWQFSDFGSPGAANDTCTINP